MDGVEGRQVAVEVEEVQRTLLAELTPPGMEAEFFGLFELTDKGSSWIGPLVIAALAETVGIRYGFLYVFFGLLIPVIFPLTLHLQTRDAAAPRRR